MHNSVMHNRVIHTYNKYFKLKSKDKDAKNITINKRFTFNNKLLAQPLK